MSAERDLFDRALGCGIPDYMIGGIERYIEHGIAPGSFLSAVICNDLKEAIRCADSINVNLLPNYVRFFYSHAPAACWGSPERFDKWMAAMQSAKEGE